MEIEGVLFTKICNISPQLDSDGAIREFYPAGRYDNAKGLRLNDYGHGPFCEFRIEMDPEFRTGRQVRVPLLN